MDYQQARQEACPVRMPKQAASRQLKPVTDNRPEAAAQRRLLEGMARGNEVAQRMCRMSLLTQSGCNCGLFSLKMAIEALGAQPGKSLPTDTDYDNAAEAAGSYAGEIFSPGAMQSVITYLGYNFNIHPFTDQASLAGVLNGTSTNPVLIAFSNFAYRMLRGDTDTGNQHHTQRGHWSVVENLTSRTLTIANPWRLREAISLDNMCQANQAMDGTTVPKSSGVAIGSQSGNGKQFDWSSYAGIYRSVGNRAYVLEMDTTTTPATMKRTIVHDRTAVANWPAIEAEINKNASTVSYITAYLTDAAVKNKIYSVATHTSGTQNNAAVTTGIPSLQPLDLNGYIVEIKK